MTYQNKPNKTLISHSKHKERVKILLIKLCIYKKGWISLFRKGRWPFKCSNTISLYQSHMNLIWEVYRIIHQCSRVSRLKKDTFQQKINVESISTIWLRRSYWKTPLREMMNWLIRRSTKCRLRSLVLGAKIFLELIRVHFDRRGHPSSRFKWVSSKEK